jgi:hypothetical protein
MDGAIKYQPVSSSGVVARGMAKYYGYVVTTATATAAIQIRDAIAAGAGTVVDAIPAGTAIGSVRHFPHPIMCSTGITFDLNGGTGGINLLFEGQP